MALAPSRALLAVPSSAISVWSMPDLVGGVEAGQRVADRAVDGLDRRAHALAAVAARVAVAQLDRLVRAGGGARGHRGAADGAILEAHVDLDGGIAPAVENLATHDVNDHRHRQILPRDCLAIFAGYSTNCRPEP